MRNENHSRILPDEQRGTRLAKQAKVVAYILADLVLCLNFIVSLYRRAQRVSAFPGVSNYYSNLIPNCLSGITQIGHRNNISHGFKFEIPAVV